MLNIKSLKIKRIVDCNIHFIFFIIIAFLIFCYNPLNCRAKVSGRCDECHTMHNSQDGEPIDPNGPSGTLLRVSDCLGCHSASDGITWKNEEFGGAPVVYNMSAPLFGAKYNDGPNQGLGGGNFYWVGIEKDDNKGHNIFSDNPDDKHLVRAPGNTGRGEDCGSNSCHFNLDQTFKTSEYPGLNGRNGCLGCHMVDDIKAPKGFHHADDSDILVGNEQNDSDGYFRFLKGHQGVKDFGVSGIEDPNWQHNPSSTEHNEYLGSYPSEGNVFNGPRSLTRKTVTAFCGGCHGEFHKQEENGLWKRHPSDAPIPNKGEYTEYFNDGYNPEAPVARPVLTGWDGPRETVTPDVDLVMCLSCHRAHGSPYPDMLRWDYDAMRAGDENRSGGCFLCHSKKNQVQ